MKELAFNIETAAIFIWAFALDDPLIMKLGGLVASLAVFFVIFKKVKVFKRFGTSGLVYTLCAALLIAVPSLFVSLFGENEFGLLLAIKFYFLILGIIHVFIVKNTFEWYHTQKLKLKIVYIIILLVFGFFLTSLGFELSKSPLLVEMWFLSMLCFIIPVLFNEAVITLAGIPEKTYKPWYYPVNESIEDPSDAELENPVVISFVFQKNSASSEETNFRAKAPAGMGLGRLFYFFINDYNSRHPEGPISYANENEEPDPWVFLKVKSKLFRTREALDQDISISGNNIRENDVLICKRIEIEKTVEQ